MIVIFSFVDTMTNEANGGAKLGKNVRIGLATFNKGATVIHSLGANPADLDTNISKIKFSARKFTNFEQSFEDLKKKFEGTLRRKSKTFVVIFSNGFQSVGNQERLFNLDCIMIIKF